MRIASASCLLIALLGASGPAVADGPAHNWTGFYVGVNAGGGWGDSDVTVGCDESRSLLAPGNCATVGFPPSPFSLDPDGFVGGGQAGFLYQAGSFVVGLETDFTWSGIAGEIKDVRLSNGDQVTSDISQSLDWLGTVRARVGWATGNWLAFATGGFAYGEVDYGYTLAVPGQNAFIARRSLSETETGWTIGAGAEYAWGKWSLRGEYLYYDLGGGPADAQYTNATLPATGIFARTNFDETSGHIARAGLSLKLN